MATGIIVGKVQFGVTTTIKVFKHLKPNAISMKKHDTISKHMWLDLKLF